ncbi:universal stress protein [Sanyastnella coralliicola]|uniref:universal stress protein n=1 Tax=Sanyastnella coralliicola TaxID=3069118 RepID=UPI0027B8FF56|nr:universal stress protein [Longitalea sp. SCSIO 12813]
MKRILVPTDFSKYAYYAAEVAAGIAKQTGARVFLLHALDIPHYGTNDRFDDAPDTAEGIFMLKRAKQEFHKLISQPFFEGVEVAEVLQWESVYETISEKAKEHEIDLIVMGSQGVSGVKEFFVGSNTEKIVRTASCPVLTVKDRMPDFRVEKVVFASNFFGESARSFRALRSFIDLFGAETHLLKVITPANFESTDYSMKLMKDFVENTGIQNFSMNTYNEMIVEKGIHEFAAQIDADLVCIETHGRTGLSHFFRQSLAEDVTNHSDRPVLSVKMQKEEVAKGAIFPV